MLVAGPGVVLFMRDCIARFAAPVPRSGLGRTIFGSVLLLFGAGLVASWFYIDRGNALGFLGRQGDLALPD